MKLPNLIQEMVRKNVPITLEILKDGRIGYNLNTQAKSEVVLALDENSEDTFTAHMRYDETEENIRCIDDVILTVKSSMHGRDSVASHWLDIMIEYGYAEVETKTVTKVHF